MSEKVIRNIFYRPAAILKKGPYFRSYPNRRYNKAQAIFFIRRYIPSIRNGWLWSQQKRSSYSNEYVSMATYRKNAK